MNQAKLIKEIKRLKKEKNAIILAHNYQTEDIFEVADEVGDSFELAKKGVESAASIIVFAGVSFMAESAKLLSPAKRVFLPALDAVCPMAAMVNEENLAALKKAHPRAAVVCYINTTAETKAHCDVCVTSANAVKICAELKEKEIIFLPDQHLAVFVQEQLPNKKIIPFMGFCRVHAAASKALFEKARAEYPKAPLLLHPETPKEFWQYATAILGTGGMIRYVQNSSEKVFLIGTEKGMCGRLKRDFPDRTFIPLMTICINMKKITLENIYESLRDEKHEIEIPEALFDRAKRPLEEMMRISA